jgi:hypothetical protein
MQLAHTFSLTLIAGLLLFSPTARLSRMTPCLGANQDSAIGSERRRTTKFDEFVTKGLSIDEVKARLDGFYDQGLKNNPGWLAYIVLYRSKSRSSRYSLSATRKYLILRGFPARKIKTINGGYRDEPLMELWVVPPGADPPKLRKGPSHD